MADAFYSVVGLYVTARSFDIFGYSLLYNGITESAIILTEQHTENIWQQSSLEKTRAKICQSTEKHFDHLGWS